ncbi:MAG: hypothetical protein ACK55I_42950, partial [bacterium]
TQAGIGSKPLVDAVNYGHYFLHVAVGFVTEQLTQTFYKFIKHGVAKLVKRSSLRKKRAAPFTDINESFFR